VADPRNTTDTDMCYHAEFGSSRSNRMGVNRKGPKIGGRWAHALLKRGRMTPETRAATSFTRAKFGRSQSNGWCVITEISEKV